MSRELVYLLLIFGLLVVPRVLQRFLIPAPVTSFGLGITAMILWGAQTRDPVIALLSTLGISSLFLFAGLEVEVQALKRGMHRLLVHLAIRALSLVLVAWAGAHYFELGWQPAALLALALLTPSTGFILDTLERLGLTPEERFWVTSKAIVGELMALALLFVVLQADDPAQLGISSLVMVGMLVGLPLLFVALGRWVVPHAPGSEFSLLVMVGLVAAYVTYELGVYYLVGAFVAGLVARLLRARMPSLASRDNLHAVRLFATFFVPVYFFHAGTLLPRDALTWDALVLGLGMTAVVLPARLGMLWLQRRFMFGEAHASSLRVSVALAPTLVFTLVLAGILDSGFGVSGTLIGALLLYATLNTLLPSLLLRMPFNVDPLLDAPAHPDDRLDEPEPELDPVRPEPVSSPPRGG
ncbi:MAG: cation:proton antiporter [Pseudomonadota bacterium]|nr:cation:proton antiporter [Pseudomonadota bacterium]